MLATLTCGDVISPNLRIAICFTFGRRYALGRLTKVIHLCLYLCNIFFYVKQV